MATDAAVVPVGLPVAAPVGLPDAAPVAADDADGGPEHARKLVLVLLAFIDGEAPPLPDLTDSDSGDDDMGAAPAPEVERFRFHLARPRRLPAALLDACDGRCWDTCDAGAQASVEELFELLGEGVRAGWALRQEGERLRVPAGYVISRVVCVTAYAGGAPLPTVPMPMPMSMPMPDPDAAALAVSRMRIT